MDDYRSTLYCSTCLSEIGTELDVRFYKVWFFDFNSFFILLLRINFKIKVEGSNVTDNSYPVMERDFCVYKILERGKGHD
jgi:hypothetical protein